MKAALVKRWFLLTILLGISAALLVPSWLQPLTKVLEPRSIVAAALFLVACTLESRTLLETLLRPWPALWALVLSYGLLPLLGWTAGLLLQPADLGIGLLIITSVPCTLASSVIWTRMAGGSAATALLVVLLTTATSWLATTAWLAAGTAAGVLPSTTALMQGLALVVLVPVGLGQLCRASPWLVRATERARTPLGILSRLLVLAMILKATVDVSLRMRLDFSTLQLPAVAATAALCVATHLVGWAAGFWSSRLWRFPRVHQIAVAFSCSQKTLPVAFYLFDSYFKEQYPLAIVAIVFYHVEQLVVDTFLAEGLAQRQQQPLADQELVGPDAAAV
jgi:sodium/bile acid cotransporter 7